MGLRKTRHHAMERVGRAALRRVEWPRRARWSAGIGALLLLVLGQALCAQTDLPDAPIPQAAFLAAEGLAGGGGGAGQESFPPEARRRHGERMPGLQPNYLPIPQPCRADSCSHAAPPRYCCESGSKPYDDYLKSIALRLYTPEVLGKMAVRGVIDPFNLLTIAWSSALSVATDPDSSYGPGLKGFAKLSGVALTEDMTGEFLGTFLIPSLDHQDPYFHRIPNASLPRRIFHCIYQVFWTEDPRGRGMVNYSTIAGVPMGEAIGSLYIPYRRIGWQASAERVATDWATAPIGNFVTEFVPDVARRINLHVVVVQRIINRVAIQEANGPAGP